MDERGQSGGDGSTIALVKLEHAPTLALAGPLLGLTAITTLLGMVLFAIIVFKSTSSTASEPVAP
ncbi:hypothetical protein OB03_03525 [Brevundimonas sp. GN22]